MGGPKRRLQVSYLGIFAALVVIGLSPHGSAVFLPCYVFACFAFGFGSPLYYAMLADSIDHGTRITGIRTAGMGYSLNSLAQKNNFRAYQCSACPISQSGRVRSGRDPAGRTGGDMDYDRLHLVACRCLIGSFRPSLRCIRQMPTGQTSQSGQQHRQSIWHERAGRAPSLCRRDALSRFVVPSSQLCGVRSSGELENAQR